MAWTSPKTWLVGETVTAANMNAHVRDNEAWLRQLTGNGDPPAADYVIASTSTSLSAWSKITNNMLAANSVAAAQILAGNVLTAHIANGNITDALMANQKVNRAGDTMTAPLTVSKDIASISGGMYAAAHVQAFSPSGQLAAIGFHRQGVEGAAIYLNSGNFYYVDNGGNVRLFWTDFNDGPGSGMNADLLDGNDALAFALAGHNHSGVYDVVGHTHAAYAALAGATFTGAIAAPGVNSSHTAGFIFTSAEGAGQDAFYESGSHTPAVTVGTYGQVQRWLAGATHVTGNITASGTITPSDERLKMDVRQLPGDQMLRAILSLEPVSYDDAELWGRTFGPAAMRPRRQIGLVAQHVQRYLPTLVHHIPHLQPLEGGLDEALGVEYQKLPVPLLAAFQEHVRATDERLARLEQAA